MPTIYWHDNRRHYPLLPFQREVSLFLQIKAGKVCGPEMTPFVLPKRWTLKMLKNCVEDYINRKTDGGECRVKQLFYRHARGKSIVRLDSESDISALLDEYLLPGKKKSGRYIMYLAADLENINSKRLSCLKIHSTLAYIWGTTTKLMRSLFINLFIYFFFLGGGVVVVM